MRTLRHIRKSARTSRSFRLGALAPVLFAAACTTTSPAQQSKPTIDTKPSMTAAEAAAQIDQAEMALAGGELQIAKTLFTAVIAADPQNDRAKLGDAEVNLAARKLDAARKAFAKLEDSPRFGPMAKQGSGIALLLQGRREKAATELSSAVKANPKLWRAWNALGLTHDMVAEWDQAQECYDQAIETNPDAASAYNNKGFSLLMQGRATEASLAFQEAVRIDPESNVVRGNLRLSLAGQGQYAEALAEAAPGDEVAALNNTGYFAMIREDYSQAESFLTQAINKNPRYYEKASRNLERLRSQERLNDRN